MWQKLKISQQLTEIQFWYEITDVLWEQLTLAMMSNLTPATYAWGKPAASVVSAELGNGINGLQGVTSQ
jgi:hypothetical protein